METIQREENPSGYAYQASQISSPDLQICQTKINHESNGTCLLGK
jgi:hypothetical protein